VVAAKSKAALSESEEEHGGGRKSEGGTRMQEIERGNACG